MQITELSGKQKQPKMKYISSLINFLKFISIHYLDFYRDEWILLKYASFKNIINEYRNGKQRSISISKSKKICIGI